MYKGKKKPSSKGGRRPSNMKNESSRRGETAKDERRDVEIRDTAERAMRGSNDVKWYSKNPQALKDVASFPFGWPNGSLTDASSGESPQFKGIQAFPGVMAIHYAPCVGKSNDLTSPINLAASKLYSRMRRDQSGSKNYDAPDLMMYVLAMDSVFAFHAWMRRVYGVARMYNYMNRYYPDALFKAMGVDATNVVANLAELRYTINTFAVKMSAFCVPAQFTLFERHRWMNENIYLDSTGMKAQTFLFVPDFFYQYSNTSTTGTSLVPNHDMFDQAYGTSISHTLISVAAIQSYANALLNAIITDEDCNVMSGDLLKAFGLNGVMRLPQIGEDYKTEAVYNQEVLTQIENVKCVGVPVWAQWSVTQNPSVNNGAITALPAVNPAATTFTIKGSSAAAGAKQLINMHSDDVSPEMMMVGTRLTTHLATADESGYSVVDACGSEVPTYITILQRRRDYDITDKEWGSPYIAEYDYVNTVYDGSMTNAPVNAIVGQASARFSNFDWAPIMAVVTATGAPNDLGLEFLGDVDNYTFIDGVSLERIHEVALLSMLFVDD